MLEPRDGWELHTCSDGTVILLLIDQKRINDVAVRCGTNGNYNLWQGYGKFNLWFDSQKKACDVAEFILKQHDSPLDEDEEDE